MKHFYFLLFIQFLLNSPSIQSEQKNALVVIMINGFSEGYLRHAPKLTELKSLGLFGYVRPTFVPETEPINFSVATGLHPDEHGVVANEFYDQEDGMLKNTKALFFLHKKNVRPFWALDPERSFCINWSGSQFAYSNRQCKHDYKVFGDNELPLSSNKSFCISNRLTMQLNRLDVEKAIC